MAIDVEQDKDGLARLGRGVFYLALLATPWLTIRVGSFTVGDILMITSLALAVLSRGFRKARPTSAPVVVALFLAPLGFGVAAMNDPDPGFGAGAIVRIIFVSFVWIWQAKSLLTEERHVLRAMGFFSAGCAISGLGAVAQYRFGVTIPGSELSSTFRAAGLAQHPNDQGGALAIALVIAFAALMRPGGKIPWIAIAAGAGVGLVLAGSVTGMISALLGIVLLLLRARLSFRSLLVSATALMAVVWLGIRAQSATGGGAGTGMGPVQRFLAASGQTGSATQDTLDDRLLTMRVAWDQIGQQPFIGRGFSDLRVVGETFVHNMLLGYWLAGGLLVLAAVCFLWGGAALTALRMSNHRLREPLLATLGTAFAFAMTAPIMYQRYAWLPVMMIYAASQAVRSTGTGVDPEALDDLHREVTDFQRNRA